MNPELLVAILLVLCTFLGGVAGYTMASEDMRKKSVEHGAAHWEVNSSGVTTFIWNKEAEK